MARYLVNAARTLIFSTGAPPPSVAAALAALELMRETPRRTERVRRNAQTLRDALRSHGLQVPDGEAAIVPLVLGDAGHAMAVCEQALERGVFAQAIRPPTVPEGTSRLRLAAMASHNAAELEWAAAQLALAVRDRGAVRELSPRPAGVFDHARAA
jgi:glycine C-acetyltransferase/8-amino-7-oxononanoate synthase